MIGLSEPSAELGGVCIVSCSSWLQEQVPWCARHTHTEQGRKLESRIIVHALSDHPESLLPLEGGSGSKLRNLRWSTLVRAQEGWSLSASSSLSHRAKCYFTTTSNSWKTTRDVGLDLMGLEKRGSWVVMSVCPCSNPSTITSSC